MILVEIKQFVSQNKTVSLAMVCQHFHISEETAEEMLAVWVRRGKVKRQELGSCVAGCGGCSLKGKCPAKFIFYSPN